jgi:hypothetical protein
VPNFVIKEASSGTVDIVDQGDSFVLYNNGEQWMIYSKNDLAIKQLYSSYDLAYGDVLVSGLGFGILALWICTKPNVRSVTVVELSEDVIKLFKDSNYVPDKLKIVNQDIRKYNTDKEYDALLLDHYELQDYDWMLKDMQTIARTIKHKNIWAWPLELIYLFKMYTNSDYESLSDLDIRPDKDFTQLWTVFVNRFFPKEKALNNIDPDTLNSYIYTFLNKDLY